MAFDFVGCPSVSTIRVSLIPKVDVVLPMIIRHEGRRYDGWCVCFAEIARETIRIVRRLVVVQEITRIHDEDPIFCSLLLSTENVDVEEELTNGFSAFYS